MSSDLQLLAEPQRQSPLAVVFLALRTLRQVGIAQIVVAVLFISRLPTAALLLIVPLVGLVILGFSLLAWWRYTFLVADGELRVTKGVLSQDKLTVPLDRVQSVSIQQRFLHRLVGLVNVSVDTAGTSEAEFEIDAVDRSIAEALQRLAADGARAAANTAASAAGQVGSFDNPGVPGLPHVQPPAPVAPVVERQILQRSVRRLITIGLTRPAFAGFAFIFPLLTFGDELTGLLPIDVPEIDGPDPALWMLWFLPVIAALLAMAGFLANLLQTVITEWNLSLTLRDRGLLREAGLISRASTATNLDRVQRLEVRRNPLEARFSIQRVTLPTIGEGDLNLPGADEAELQELRSLVIDDDARVPVLDRRVSPKSVFLVTRNTAVVALLLAIGLFFPLGAWSLLFLLMVPWAWAAERRSNRLMRWGLVRDGIAKHEQFVNVFTQEMMLRKVNGAAIRQSLFERKRDLATLHLQTADGTVSVGMLPLDEAKAVRDQALMITETNTKAWM